MPSVTLVMVSLVEIDPIAQNLVQENGHAYAGDSLNLVSMGNLVGNMHHCSCFFSTGLGYLKIFIHPLKKLEEK